MLRFAVPVVVPAELAPSIRSAPVVAVIPSRYRSTRLPGKPLAMIDGAPMVEHVWRRASAASLVDVVLVATDDERVARVVDGFGGTAVMTSADHATGTDRLAEIASVLESALVVNVQGDEPMITGTAIDEAITPLRGRSTERMSTLRRRIEDPEDTTNPSVVKIVVDRDGYALYFSRSPIPHVRAGESTPVLWRHMGLYVYRREFLLEVAGLPQTPLERAEGLEQLRVLEHGYRIVTAETTLDTIGVDTNEDLEKVRRAMTATATVRL
jgi:3-deoxy-manno-octulosonate cytidylyltransferase (CMP-KDO synthetase)